MQVDEDCALILVRFWFPRSFWLLMGVYWIFPGDFYDMQHIGSNRFLLANFCFTKRVLTNDQFSLGRRLTSHNSVVVETLFAKDASINHKVMFLECR